MAIKNACDNLAVSVPTHRSWSTCQSASDDSTQKNTLIALRIVMIRGFKSRRWLFQISAVYPDRCDGCEIKATGGSRQAAKRIYLKRG